MRSHCFIRSLLQVPSAAPRCSIPDSGDGDYVNLDLVNSSLAFILAGLVGLVGYTAVM